MRTSRALALALAVASAAPATRAAAQPADTTGHSRTPLFTEADALVAGGFVVGTLLALPLDRALATRLRDSTTQAVRFAKQAAAFFNVMGTPGSMLIGGALYGAGRALENEEMADIGLHGTEAIAAGVLLTGVLKTVAGRRRPYAQARKDDPHDFGWWRGFRHDQYRSFPSGHATMGFAAAAAVTSEASRFWPKSTWYVAPVMYGGATMIAVARMYSDEHWASDVVLGAAIGTFAGLKVTKYHHDHPDNRIDRWLLTVSGVPTAGGIANLRLSVMPLPADPGAPRARH